MNDRTLTSKTMDCFWPKCSDHKRCEAYGSCVAKAQAGGATFTPSHQELFSAIYQHAKAIVKLTETVPTACSSHETREQRTRQAPIADDKLTLEVALREAERCRRYPDPVLNEQVIVVLADALHALKASERRGTPEEEADWAEFGDCPRCWRCAAPVITIPGFAPGCIRNCPPSPQSEGEDRG